MEQAEQEKQQFDLKKQSYSARLADVKGKIDKKEGNVEDLQKQLKDLELEGLEIKRRDQEMLAKEKKTPWNVDTISKEGFQKTVINKSINKKPDENLTDEERAEKMRVFVKENEKIIKEFGMLRKYEDSKKFLTEHSKLVNEETANYLVIWCINLQMEEKTELMSHVAHQCICLQYILELGKQLDVDPRGCSGSFFAKIQDCVPEYKADFEKEITDFIARIKKRAEEKIQEAVAEQEEEDRKERLGPGGLDPAEVFDELPEVSLFILFVCLVLL